jgi:hypothetical protein
MAVAKISDLTTSGVVLGTDIIEVAKPGVSNYKLTLDDLGAVVQLLVPNLDDLASIVYAGNANKVLAINGAGTALVLTDPPTGINDHLMLENIGTLTHDEIEDSLLGIIDNIASLGSEVSSKQPADAQLDALSALSYSGNNNKIIAVNSAGTGFEFIDAPDPGGSDYTLPTATESVLGGVKVGSGLTIDSGVLSADIPDTYTLPEASASALGGIKIGTGLNIDGEGVVTVDVDNYELPVATASVLGGVIAGAGLEVDGDGVLSLAGGPTYELPIASDSVLGGFRVGNGLSINEVNGILEVDLGAVDYDLPAASDTVRGGIKVGDGLTIVDDVLSVDAGVSFGPATASVLGGIKVGDGLEVEVDGTLSVTPGSGGDLPIATSSTLGGIKLGTGFSVTEDGVLSVDSGELIGIPDEIVQLNDEHVSVEGKADDDGTDTRSMYLLDAYRNTVEGLEFASSQMLISSNIVTPFYQNNSIVSSETASDDTMSTGYTGVQSGGETVPFAIGTLVSLSDTDPKAAIQFTLLAMQDATVDTAKAEYTLNSNYNASLSRHDVNQGINVSGGEGNGYFSDNNFAMASASSQNVQSTRNMNMGNETGYAVNIYESSEIHGAFVSVSNSMGASSPTHAFGEQLDFNYDSELLGMRVERSLGLGSSTDAFPTSSVIDKHLNVDGDDYVTSTRSILSAMYDNDTGVMLDFVRQEHTVKFDNDTFRNATSILEAQTATVLAKTELEADAANSFSRLNLYSAVDETSANLTIVANGFANEVKISLNSAPTDLKLELNEISGVSTLTPTATNAPAAIEPREYIRVINTSGEERWLIMYGEPA